MNKPELCSSPCPAAPPAADVRPEVKTVHGAELSDGYAWLKAANWQEVLRNPDALPEAIRALIEAENRYAMAVLAPLDGLRAELVKEMRGRIREDDAEVPRKDGPWFYYSRYNCGGQHPVFCRRKGASGPEEILLDGDALAAGKSFFDLGAVRHAPSHDKLAWSADETGSELYSIKVRPLDPCQGKTGEGNERRPGAFEETVPCTDGEILWMADSLGFYYVRIDADHRPSSVFRHRLGSDPADDECVFHAHDPGLFVSLRRSQTGRFAIISAGDHDSTECRLLSLAGCDASPRLVVPRAPGVRYDAEDHEDRLFLRTNAGGADDFKIVSAPLAEPGQAAWREEVPHRPGRMIIKIAVFPAFLVRIEREGGLPRIVARCLASGEEHAVAFAEEAYALGLDDRLEYDTTALRFTYSSMTTPWETYDYDLVTRQRVLRKRQEIPSGHDPAHYVTRRLFAPAADGEQIPVTLLYRAGVPLDGSAPVLLYGYGAYGTHLPASFSSNRLSLADRGFIYALAHVRGGTDKGWRWYMEGKLSKKPNSFSDFISVARHLITSGFTRAGRIVAQGGSAGGLLVGAAVNLAPELFAGIIADVPFVDALNTMLDESLPLTPPEWLEWGNPITDPAAFSLIRSYSPYDNVEAKRYPPMLVLGGLTDPRVTYWEPLKWVAKIRARMTGGGPIFLKTNMGAGHAGAPGRFDHLEEIALQYAFAIACVEGGLSQAKG